MTNYEQSPSPATITRRSSELRRLAGAVAAVIAVLALWLIGRYGAGLHPHTPAFGPTQRPATLSAGFVIAVAIVVALAAWGLVEILQAKARRPRRTWLITAAVVLVLSLSGPLSGHGVSGGDRVGLIFMHLAVAAALVPLYARSLHLRRRGGSADLSTRPPMPIEGASR